MRLVVIGGNAAGLSAASQARRLDRSLEIAVYEKGPTISYAACGLPYYVEGRVRRIEDLTVYSPEEFQSRRHIAVRVNTPVTAIRHPQRQITLAGGERVGYDKLILATGARPDLRRIAGSDQPHVFALQALDDAVRLRAFLAARRPRSAAVIGAGYIGLEMVEALRAHGLRVTLFEADDSLLGCRDATLVTALRARLERFGVALRTAEVVRAIEPDRVNGVSADVVVVSAGFRPNAELAQEAGFELGVTGAIRVNELLETNCHGVFAAGDCAEVIHRVTGRPSYIPLGTTANKMGRIAGANAAGRRERFPGVMGTSIVRVCGLGVGATGLTALQAKAEGFDAVSAAIDGLERPPYFWGARLTVELVAERRGGRLLGGLVIGERGVAGRVNVLATALAARMTVEQIEHLDLCYAPPFATVWDPVLIAARQLGKLLD